MWGKIPKWDTPFPSSGKASIQMKTNNNIRGSICFFDNTICKYLQFIKAPNNQDFINECCQFCRVYKFSTLWIAFKINVLILQTLAKNLPLGIQTFDGHSETKLYLQPMSMTWKEQYTIVFKTRRTKEMLKILIWYLDWFQISCCFTERV